MELSDLHNLYIDMIPTLKYNYDLVESRGNMNQLTNSLETNILEAIV